MKEPSLRLVDDLAIQPMPGPVRVPEGARAAGGVADAVLVVDPAEHERRRTVGLESICTLDVLDALMNLPLGVPVRVADIAEVALADLRGAPPGCVEWLDGGGSVRRLAMPPAAVPLVVVRAATLRSGIRRAGAFAPFATRVVQLETLPARWPAPALDAVAAGVGVWAPGPGGVVAEFVAPAEFRLRWVKPARWRFAERAYGEWLRATGR